MTEPVIAGEAVADDEAHTDEVEIVEDDAGRAPDGATATETPDTWRGPSIGRWIAFAAIALGVLALDQASKAWVVAMLPNAGDSRVIIDGGWLNIVHGRNNGALFGLLPQSALIFAIVSLGVVGLIVVYHRRAGRGYLTTVALALLLGGAIGNLIDRLQFGYVVDWVDMGIGAWRFFTYNVADAAITTAIVLLIAMSILPRLAEWGAGGAADG